IMVTMILAHILSKLLLYFTLKVFTLYPFILGSVALTTCFKRNVEQTKKGIYGWDSLFSKVHLVPVIYEMIHQICGKWNDHSGRDMFLQSYLCLSYILELVDEVQIRLRIQPIASTI
ncbi:hypothetical protein ACJX0J_034914, partial [Zea mays]